jgi:hypothetical protein
MRQVSNGDSDPRRPWTTQAHRRDVLAEPHLQGVIVVETQVDASVVGEVFPLIARDLAPQSPW